MNLTILAIAFEIAGRIEEATDPDSDGGKKITRDEALAIVLGHDLGDKVADLINEGRKKRRARRG